jgi:starvation-inducible DNA-binding protein
MTTATAIKKQIPKEQQWIKLATPTDLASAATRDISGAMNAVLADVFSLYLKTKNFHWHLSGPHFRDYHLMFDEQASQIFAMTDPIAERVRKMGGLTIKSIGHISKLQRIADKRTTLSPRICSPSCVRTTRLLRPDCVKFTMFATSIATSPLPA